MEIPDFTWTKKHMEDFVESIYGLVVQSRHLLQVYRPTNELLITGKIRQWRIVDVEPTEFVTTRFISIGVFKGLQLRYPISFRSSKQYFL